MVFFSAADPASRDLECPRAPLAPLCAPQPHIVRTHIEHIPMKNGTVVPARKGAKNGGANGSPARRPARRSAVRTPRPLRARSPRLMARNIKQMSDRCAADPRSARDGAYYRGAGAGAATFCYRPLYRRNTHAHSNTPHPRALPLSAPSAPPYAAPRTPTASGRAFNRNDSVTRRHLVSDSVDRFPITDVESDPKVRTDAELS